MKVLQVGSSLFDWGGIERYVLYLTEGLRERGHQVEVTCPPGSPLDKRISEGKRLLALHGQFRPSTVVPYLRLLRRNRYDVVHIHFSPDFIIPAWAARVTRQPLVVMTRHLALTWSRSKVKRYTKLFDHIIGVSEATRSKLLASGIPADFVSVAKAGCPALEPASVRDESRSALGIGEDAFAIGSFGRLVKEKGVDLLASASSQLPEGVEVHLFGDGPLRADLERVQGPKLRVHGFTAAVADAMNAMDVVAVPSVWEEAFPYSVLEAMSLGKPVIASRVGGLPEMVDENVTGFLFDKGDSQGLISSIEALASDPARLASMSVAAKDRHAFAYTVAHMAERIEAVYERLVRSRH
jgi:glycosyltransferase involved in cell wall biosynthesis